MEKLTMEKLTNYCKQYGFIFQGSEIYGGLANTWDYGPLGARLKNNVKDTWRKRFIQERSNAYEVDAAILMHPRVWEASGHVSGFSDPLIDCKECKMRHRADNLIDDFDSDAHADGMTQDEMMEYIREHKVPCPNCGKSNYTANGEEMYSIQGDSKFVSLNVMTALNRAQLSSFMNFDASIDLVLIPMNADTMAQALILKSQSMIQEESKKFIR